MPQEFEILDLGRVLPELRQHLTRSHRTEFYHIIWFQHGAKVHWVDFQPVQIHDNSILFLNKDVVQRFGDVAELQCKAILFTDKFFCKTEADVRFLRSSSLFYDLFRVSQIQSQSSILGDLFRQMEVELAHENDAYQSDLLQNLLHNFLLHASRAMGVQHPIEVRKGSDLGLVLEFRELLDAQFSAHKQVAHFAQTLAVTEKRLNQATTKVLGKSPKQIIDERVMLEAKRLLAHTVKSVKEIGFLLGFEEPTNFVKFFKKHVSVTPAAFRVQVAMA